MSKREKIVASWRNQPQPYANAETVEAILAHFFSDHFTKATGAGSHQCRVSHPALFGHPHFIGGTLSVPVSGGQTGRPIYLKRIAEAIALIEEAENHDNDTDENEN